MTRWIRLDTTWSMCDWLAQVGPEVRLAWIELLCYVGGCGNTRAVAPALSVEVAAEIFRVSETAVRVCLTTAIEEGSLQSNNDRWRVVGWHLEQSRFIPGWQSVRANVLQRDGEVCAYCGSHANSVDHIVPYSRGGSSEMSNLVAACGTCNRSKKDHKLEEWLRG